MDLLLTQPLHLTISTQNKYDLYLFLTTIQKLNICYTCRCQTNMSSVSFETSAAEQTLTVPPAGVSCLKIKSNPRSYHRIRHDGKIIHYVGKGPTSSPGHPSGHQYHKNQSAFFTSYGKSKRIVVFIENTDGSLRLLGRYIIVDWARRISNEGFVYYSYQMHRVLDKQIGS